MSRGRPASSAGLDGRPDVIGVDVAVVEPLVADDHDRVADAGPHVAKGVHLGVVGVKQVHHLVTQLAGVDAARRLLVHVDDDRVGVGSDRQLVVGDDVTERVEEEHQPRAARVDHPCLFQDRELIGGPRERLLRLVARAVGERDEVVFVIPCSLGPRARDRQDRPFDRAQHGASGQFIGVGQGAGESRRTDPPAARHLLNESAQ